MIHRKQGSTSWQPSRLRLCWAVAVFTIELSRGEVAECDLRWREQDHEQHLVMPLHRDHEVMYA